MYYVVMTDKFMSGWGEAQGKINKLVLPCDTYEEALVVQQNAEDRSEMKHVNICTHKPSYNSKTHKVSWHARGDYRTWYRTDRPFKKQKVGGGGVRAT